MCAYSRDQRSKSCGELHDEMLQSICSEKIEVKMLKTEVCVEYEVEIKEKSVSLYTYI